MKKLLFTILSVFVGILIIIFPQTIKQGVTLGINLTLYSVIPALLPFMLLTNIMIKNDLCRYISYFLYPILSKLFRVSVNGCFAVIIGFTCGYPMGAKTVNDLYLDGKIGISEARYLITFCNNCSLPFLTNYIIYQCLKSDLEKYNISIGIVILLLYITPVLTGIINGFILKPDIKPNNLKEKKTDTNPISNTISSLCTLGIYVIIFSVLISFINNADIIPTLKYILSGICEITSGANNIAVNMAPSILKIYIILFCSVFGGLSITFQSFSQLKDKSLKKAYIGGKSECLLIYSLLFGGLCYFLKW